MSVFGRGGPRTDQRAWAQVSKGEGAHAVADITLQPSAAGRVLFVDLLRFVAAFQMLQGHSIAAVLAPAYRVGTLHALWSVARGLTSVAFLFAAGLSFYLATARDFAAHKQRGGAAAARFRRGLLLIALGYLLHAPLVIAWSDDPATIAAAWRAFGAVDVLQCIGASLVLLELLVLASPSLRVLAYTSAAIGVMLLGLAPLAHDWNASGWLAAYLSPRTGSLFPLLPWSAHVFLGVACAAWVQPMPSSAPTRLLVLGAVLLGAARLPVTALLADPIGRLGWVVGISGLLAAVCQRFSALPAWVRVLSGQTLFLYVFHVLLVYGDAIGLRALVGPRLAPGPAVLVALVVVAVSGGAALAYQRVRRPARLAAASRTR
jgi:uncharacterized membrane protein